MSRLGRMRHLITIQFEERQADGYGGYNPVWKDLYADIYADVEPLSGDETTVARQVEDSTMYRVTTHYRPDVKAAMRVKFGTEFLNIRAVRNLGGRNRRLELECEGGVAA